MSALTLVLVAATLLLCGVYAGLVVMTQIGILPGLRLLRPWMFVEVWAAMDRYMGKSMPPYKAVMLLVTLAATVMVSIRHQTVLGAALGLSFLLSLAGLVLTVRKQLPLSARLGALPSDTPEAVLLEMREQTARNISERMYLALLAFALPCLATVFLPFA